MQNFIITVFGQKGSGKSEITKNHIIPYCPTPIFIYDRLSEYKDGVIYTDLDIFVEDLIEEKNESGVYIIRPDSDDMEEAFLKMVRLYHRPCTLVVEEADMLCTTARINEDIEYFIKYGRHFDINLVFISRRPAEINRLMTSQSDFIITFRQTEGRDIDYLKKLSDVGEKAKNLDKSKYQFLIIHPDLVPKEFEKLKVLKENLTLS